ncbi:hypothetical protein ABS71_05855 [bacterium SCN 62-11]|nr:MAG: hypothetical protein ABS71_05855 [bacterium SCN 62-11]
MLFTSLSLGCHAAPIVYDNSSTGDGSGSVERIASFGNNNSSATYGETFVAPVGATTFNSVSFDIRGFGGTGPQTVDAYLALWDNTTNGAVAGSILASVTGLVIPGTSSTLYERVTADFGSIAVSAGQLYVVYYTTLTSSGSYPGSLRYAWDSNYTAGNQFGGHFVFSNSLSSSALSDGSGWDGGGAFNGPLAFVATFNATGAAPELNGAEATVPLTISCLALLAYRPRRRPVL